MDALINTSSSEFNDTSHVESKGAYWNRVNKSVADIEEGKGTVFTMHELEEYLHNMPTTT